MFQSKTKKFKADLEKAISLSYKEIGTTVVDVVKGEAPVISGKLRDSTSFSSEEDGVYITNSAEYAPFVEFGTYKSSANPFMRRGIFKSISDIRKIISEKMGVKK